MDARQVVPGLHGTAPDTAWRDDGQVLSLVRRPAPPRPLRFGAVGGQALEIDALRSALVVVDMQNDFCHPQGWIGQKGQDVAPMRAPIAAIARLLPAWRAAGGTVLWLNWGIRADRLNLPPTVLYKGSRGGTTGYGERSPEDHGPSLVPGHWGAQVIEELPVAGSDITVYKHRLSGFWDNELDSVLRRQGVSTLLYAGVNTDRCVFSTLQDAGFLGYDNILLADACGTPSPAYVTDAIHFLVRQLHGFVAGTDALLAALDASLSPQTQG
ncbi:pyrimidine utilization protein B [Pigmentiphaga soli]|uniref:Pyrimidine utilization protein B n=1 Tax=Pigmentiphaga soli TaxID=1007095 RepID=A0ABP8HBY3_9BURK